MQTVRCVLIHSNILLLNIQVRLITNKDCSLCSLYDCSKIFTKFAVPSTLCAGSPFLNWAAAVLCIPKGHTELPALSNQQKWNLQRDGHQLNWLSDLTRLWVMSLHKWSSPCQDGDPGYSTEAVDSSHTLFYCLYVQVLTFSVKNAGKAPEPLTACQ